MTNPKKTDSKKNATKKGGAKDLPAGEVAPDGRHWLDRVQPPEVEGLSTTLTPDEVSAVSDLISANSRIIGMARKYRVRRPRTEVPHMAVGTVGNVAQGSIPGGTPSEAEPGVDTLVLYTSKVVLPWTVTEEFLSANPDSTTSQLMVDMMITQLANDTEDLAVNGDESLRNEALLRSNDGWFKLVREHGNTLSDEVPEGTRVTFNDLERILRALPRQYRRDVAKLRYFVSYDTLIDLAESRAARLGDMPDSYLTGKDTNLNYGGIPIVPVRYIPAGTILLTDPQNLIFGLQDDVEVRASWAGRDAIAHDERYYALHVRMDFVVQNPEAAVLYEQTRPVPVPTRMDTFRVQLADMVLALSLKIRGNA